jgi:hypothetical protein
MRERRGIWLIPLSLLDILALGISRKAFGTRPAKYRATPKQRSSGDHAMTNIVRTVATVALTLVASTTFLLGALAPANADAGLRGTAAARIVA